MLDLLIEAFLHIKFNIFMDHNTFYPALVISVTKYQTNTLSIIRRGQPGSGETIDGGDGSGWPSSSQVGNPFNFWPTPGQWESRQMNNCTDDQTIGPMYKKVEDAPLTNLSSCNQTQISNPSKVFLFQVPSTVLHPGGKQADKIVSTPPSHFIHLVLGNDAREACHRC